MAFRHHASRHAVALTHHLSGSRSPRRARCPVQLGRCGHMAKCLGATRWLLPEREGSTPIDRRGSGCAARRGGPPRPRPQDSHAAGRLGSKSASTAGWKPLSAAVAAPPLPHRLCVQCAPPFVAEARRPTRQCDASPQGAGPDSDAPVACVVPAPAMTGGNRPPLNSATTHVASTPGPPCSTTARRRRKQLLCTRVEGQLGQSLYWAPSGNCVEASRNACRASGAPRKKANIKAQSRCVAARADRGRHEVRRECGPKCRAKMDAARQDCRPRSRLLAPVGLPSALGWPVCGYRQLRRY